MAAGLFLFAFAVPATSLFDPVPQVVEIGAEYLRFTVPSLLLPIAGVVLSQSFVGAGDTVPPRATNPLTLRGVEVPSVYGLAQGLGLGLTGVCWDLTPANTANGLLFIIRFRLGRWKAQEV